MSDTATALADTLRRGGKLHYMTKWGPYKPAILAKRMVEEEGHALDFGNDDPLGTQTGNYYIIRKDTIGD